MYTYERKRSDYGKQCRFHNHGPIVLINMTPDPSLEKNWIQKNPVDKTTNETNKWSEHDANTIRVEYFDHGIAHREGGWPVDVHLDDPEQVTRFRRKTEKEKLYLQSVKKMSILTEHFIKQNNSIDIFQPYFTDPKCQEFQTLVPSYQTVAIIVDPCVPKRPIQNISWSSEQGSLLAISFADLKFQMANLNNSSNSYVFDFVKLSMFERETKREKLIEAKIRENKTKMHSKLPNKVDNFNEKAELAIKECEKEIAEVVDRLCHNSVNEMTEDL
ncbi:PREDICTED: dynein intermediate chain 3, ciliary-like [Diuraphis noxia]|uniref:dynein intermediate chain 3, ciliary-like n=1 Tax=Diuraphis noxia TaxID=143948 RepID=UPI0007639BB0|nr:PREDICTED: dynein intermediate chain 3, ciliary-like [Diuraphis noxia]